jgi:hypothetical protein
MRKIYYWCFTFCFVLQAWAGVLKPITPGAHNNISNKASITETSSESDIIIVSPTTDIPSENIDYTAYNSLSSLTITNSVAVGEFTIRDGGASGADSDEVSTTINFIQFKLTNSENIAAIAIFDEEGETALNLREITDATEILRFLGLTLSAEDNGTKNFTVRVTFKSNVTDNAQIELTVTRVGTIGESSNVINTAAGSAQTSTSGDDNRIEVTATEFLFEQEPTNGNALEILQPFPVIIAADANGNKDFDFNETAIPINTVNPSSIVSESYDMTNGEAVLNNIVFSSAPLNSVRLTAISSFVGISQEFIINGPLFNLATKF